MKQVEVQLTGPQDDFVFCNARFPAIIGGLGSGKTQAGIERAIFLLMNHTPRGGMVGYYMPTYDLIKLRSLPGFQARAMEMGIRHEINKSNYSIELSGLGTIICRSYDNPERIISYETSHAIVDELDTLSRDKAQEVWTKVKERNRARSTHSAGNTIGNVTTPNQGYSGFGYQRWGKNPDANHLTISAPTATNVFMQDVEAYIESIMMEYDPITAEAMVMGAWVNFTKNKVYHFFDRRRHHTSRKLKIKDKILHVSIDFNVGGCCAVVWVEEAGKGIAVTEFVSHDTMDFCNKLAQFNKHTRKIYVYPDATGSKNTTNATDSDLGIIRREGYHVRCDAANPAVRDRINSVNGALAHDRLMINTDECPLLTDALESQGYDDKGKPEKFNDHPSIDDWTDSGGYYVHQRFPVNKGIIQTSMGMAA